jgi:hypothetical protein
VGSGSVIYLLCSDHQVVWLDEWSQYVLVLLMNNVAVVCFLPWRREFHRLSCGA